MKRRVEWAMALGMASVVAMGVAQLALTDIHHGGEDLRLEWRVVQVCSLLSFAATAMALWTLRGIWKAMP